MNNEQVHTLLKYAHLSNISISLACSNIRVLLDLVKAPSPSCSNKNFTNIEMFSLHRNSPNILFFKIAARNNFVVGQIFAESCSSLSNILFVLRIQMKYRRGFVNIQSDSDS